MGKRRTGLNPLAYMGVEPTSPPLLVTQTFGPTATNVEFNVGTIWVDTVLDTVHILTSVEGNTATWSTLATSAGTDGQLLIAATGTVAEWASLTSTGGTISVSGGANTLNIEAVGAVSWVEVTGTTQAMAVNTGYVMNNVALITCTLPVTAPLGSIVRISGYNSGGWKIAQNAGQDILIGSSSTTLGVGGSLASTVAADSVEMVCVVADSTFNVISSIGNITVV